MSKIDISLARTCVLMTSDEYTDRFKAEYYQLILRMNGLMTMLDQYKNGTLPFTPLCSYELLRRQFNSMNVYRLLLEERAKVENIKLV